jgi:cysteine desulfurase
VIEPSHVLLALGLTDGQAKSTIRVGFGRFNTPEEVESAAVLLCSTVEKIGGKGVENVVAA